MPSGSDGVVSPPTVAENEVEQWVEEEEGEEGEELSLPTPASAESVAEKYARSQLRVVRETKDYTLDYLQYALKEKSYIIDVAPEYQRRQRWTQTKRSLLIESFLMNIPVPPVFLFEKEYNAYEVIDGRQRLDTLREFFANNFALNGLRYWKEFNHKRFNQLPAVIQRGLQRRSLSAIVLLAETRRPADDEFDVRRVLFDRLNTGGEKLNPQELRNALYPGPFNHLLITLARHDLFTSVWGIPPKTPDEDAVIPDRLSRNVLYKSMADCELVLRFYAIRDALLGDIKGSLRSLLDKTMRKRQGDGDPEIESLRQEFLRCLSLCVETFGPRTFRLPSTDRLSRPLYDALMVAASLNPEGNPVSRREEVVRALQVALTDSANYEVLVGRGNTIEAVRQRVELAATVLRA